jgi:hypothetical protein
LGTSVAERSFISRFFYKALEVIGAAIATAVSGYLVAHLGGFMPSHTQAPTSPAAVVAPSEHPVAKSVSTNAAAKEPAATAQPSQSAAVPIPAPTDADRRAAQTPPEAAGSATQPARKNGNTKTATTPPRKSTKSETAASEAKPSDVKTLDAKTSEAKTSEARTSEARTSEAKPREAEDKDSVEARVKAALANVDANRPPAAEATSRRENQSAQPRPVDAAPSTTAAIPRPLESAPAATGSATQPRAADLGSPAQQPMTQPAATQSPAVQTPSAPVQATPVQPTQPQQPDALTSVEIKSRPVATVETLPAAPEAVPPQEEEKGVLSIFKHILPDLRRPASTDEAPRPPAPVGQ